MQFNNSKCITCGKIFDQRYFGLMDCWIHPLPFDSNLGCYPCCGRIPSRREYRSYNELTEGCTKIDHASSIEDLEKIMKIGYGTVPFKYSHYLKIMAIYSKSKKQEFISEEQRIIPISNVDDLDKKISFCTFYATIELDLKEIYDSVEKGDYDLSVIEESESEDEVEDDAVTNYFHYSHRDVVWEEEQLFLKFYIVRRMECNPNYSRIELLRNESKYVNKLKRKYEHDNTINVV